MSNAVIVTAAEALAALEPHEISDIADRLRTRFAWGLLADIEPPELEVRSFLSSPRTEKIRWQRGLWAR